MNPMTDALAQAHITDLRRQACRARLAGLARKASQRPGRARVLRHRPFGEHFLPVGAHLFHHS